MIDIISGRSLSPLNTGIFYVLNPEITFSSGNLIRITINFYHNRKSQGLCHYKGKEMNFLHGDCERHLVASSCALSVRNRKYGAAALRKSHLQRSFRNGAAAVVAICGCTH